MRKLALVSIILFTVLAGPGQCFMPGQIYKYSYTTSIQIDRPNSGNASMEHKSKDLFPLESRNEDDTLLVIEDALKLIKVSAPFFQEGTVRLNAVVEISALWDRDGDYVRKLKVLSARVGRGEKPAQVAIKQLTTHPVYFSQRLGGNVIIYRSLEESTESVNIKQGIINLLLYQTQPGTIKELDISGECDATYGREGHLVTKVKTNCKPRHITGQFSNPHEFWALNTISTYKMTYDVDDMNTLKFVSCDESHVSRINTDNNIGSKIYQRQELSLLGSRVGDNLPGLDIDAVVKTVRSSAGTLVESLLISEPEKAYCESKRETEASAVIAKERENLDKINAALPEAANAFLNVVTALRQTNNAAILEILNDPDNFYIVNELIDACVAADTKDSQEALQDFLVFDDEAEVELPERYLFAVAFTTHPNQRNVLRLKELVSQGIVNPKVRTSTLLALGAILRTLYKRVDRFSLSLLTDTQNWLLEQLNSCRQDECKIIYLGALRNAALPGALPTVLYYAEHSEMEEISLAALDALTGYDQDLLAREAKPALFRILNEIEQPMQTSVRLAAVDLLLSARLTAKEIAEVISTARQLPNKESTAYVIRRIADRVINDDYYRKLFERSNMVTSLFNYDVLAVPGNSTALTNTFLNSRDVGSTYSLFIEKTPSGLLKKSITDVVAKSANGHILPLVKVGIYTDGLDSLASYFGSSDDKTTDSQKEPAAGLKLALMGVGLRPIQFFSSQGEMMSALWNAPSEPVSALQGNILLHDHSQLLSLSNGLTVDVQLHSCLSLDLSGAVSFSIWSRQSQSFVRNSGSFALRGDTHLHSALFSLGLNYTLETAVEVHFTSEVDFYDTPINMCMQMIVPDYETSVRASRHATVVSQRPYRRNTATKYLRNGSTFVLDPRNTAQCNEMENKKQS